MTQIIVMVAVAENGVIGNGMHIPWRISEDFKRFKRLTMGFPCIMGRLTYESLPSNARPLPGRENIVLTSNPAYRPDGVTVLNTFQEAVRYVRSQPAEKAFITGGVSIYRQGLEIADFLELTRIHKEAAGDVIFPEVDWSSWRLIQSEERESMDTLNHEMTQYSFLTYQRKS